MKLFLALFASLCLCNLAAAQTTEDYAVELTAAVQVSPPKITLQWKKLTAATAYNVYKKAKGASAWGSAIATLTPADSTYTDNAVIADSAYEYQVLAPSVTFNATGYIFTGVKNPAIHNKGILLLIIDSTFSDSCATNITTLMRDLSGDGWQIIRHDFPRNKPDSSVKAVLAADYAAHANVNAVLLVGHIAVPYSGDLNPDGHPDHLGAWPADVYYSCIGSGWTDVSVNDISAGYAANQNIPGDGKWDQTVMPSNANMQVSRIDFYNMPAFTATEIQMMRSYLTKAHTYKMDSLPIRRKALISDNFGAFSGEAFAANGWRNFSPFVSRDSVSAVSFISSLAASSYLWAYGCGGGTFTSAGGIGATTDFATNPVNGIFTMLFGSYFGDWNVQNNFLRAPLCASTPALTCCWAGRPNWFFHHLALGENIGYSALLTQNNNGLYQPTNYGAHWVHVTLMGDLSLRTDYIKPPSNLVITKPFHNGAILTWTASPDTAVLGYYVYRADSAFGYFKKISPMLTATSFHDTVGVSGKKYYMVRPTKLQSTPSGGYYNLGIGITDTGTISYTTVQVAAIIPNINLNLFPNPAQNNITVTVSTDAPCTATMYVMNIAGERFYTVTKQLQPGNNAYSLNVSSLPAGIYVLCLKSERNTVVKEWVKE